eukprot:2152408-Rhodomonas_salina.1
MQFLFGYWRPTPTLLLCHTWYSRSVWALRSGSIDTVPNSTFVLSGKVASYVCSTPSPVPQYTISSTDVRTAAPSLSSTPSSRPTSYQVLSPFYIFTRTRETNTLFSLTDYYDIPSTLASYIGSIAPDPSAPAAVLWMHANFSLSEVLTDFLGCGAEHFFNAVGSGDAGGSGSGSGFNVSNVRRRRILAMQRPETQPRGERGVARAAMQYCTCLLYTSDAADDM